MGPGPGPGRLGQKPGCLRRSSAESAEGAGRRQPGPGGGAEALWPPRAPVAPRSPAGRPPGSGRAPPLPAAAPPAAPARGARLSLPMAGCEVVSVSGFEEFSRAVEQHRGKTIFAYFTGSKDAGGKSWCPDCVQGEAGPGGCGPGGRESPPRGSPGLPRRSTRVLGRPVPGTGEPGARRILGGMARRPIRARPWSGVQVTLGSSLSTCRDGGERGATLFLGAGF